ncbi:MAG: type II toxin-antitoxin system RelE/ParE family toxin [Candidatus Peribacteraceae bacterium]|nr:type II toxin-antitoxin system RelE/ParE family toxin [Candidatus Peribacteraceae bacterium]MDD5740276.1 type II toxin-antitoxin system RelE/ParE family toxin [Candidatus Peribacteraceae bacterium]
MKYKISYSALHDPKSLKKIDRSDLSAIKQAIEEKLTIAPEAFGKPLKFSLKGLRSLRVGDFRVLYCIDGLIVRITHVAHRSTIYRDAK